MTAVAAAGVLDNRVLVLNTNWTPVNVMSVWKAIQKVWNDRALFVDPSSHVTYDFEGWVSSWADVVSAAREAALELALAAGDEDAFNAVLVQDGDSFVPRDRTIGLEGLRIRLPEVVVCTEYGGYQSKVSTRPPKFSRTNIYRRDKNTCQYCGHKCKIADLTMEHVTPKSQGGEMTWLNIALACFDCNQKKRDRTPKQAGMRLIRQPFRPTSQDVAITPIERLRRKIGTDAPKTWEAFVGQMYWDVELKDD